jgi:hypothetical protein
VEDLVVEKIQVVVMAVKGGEGKEVKVEEDKGLEDQTKNKLLKIYLNHTKNKVNWVMVIF